MYCKHFSELSNRDAAIAGGKGASLGEMTNAGIPVPPGFVVLADAFEKFLDETNLNTEIDAILHTVKTDEMRSVEHASERVQKLILEAKMPENIGREIVADFENLDAEHVAVRSSATAEDSNSAAWAGQLDTYLNTTHETLLVNVQRCWASLFTSRAIFYRFEKDLHATKISVAVVVQKMIQSEISGIAFSVHPVTEDRNQLIIEAGFGLGEAIVSGQITPDSYVVEKNPRRIIDKNIAEQERGIYRKETGGIGGDDMEANEWRSIPIEKRNEQKLSDEQIIALSQLIIHIEQHYGFPCDIEWALEKDIVYITQSRPITTLSDTTNGGSAHASLGEDIPSPGAGSADFLSDIRKWRFWGRWRMSIFGNSPWNCYARSRAYKRLMVPSGFVAGALNVDGHVYALEGDHQIFDEFIQKKFSEDRAWFQNFFAVCEESLQLADMAAQEKDIPALMDAYADIACCSMLIHFCDKGLESVVPELAAASGMSSDDFTKLLVPFQPTYLMRYKEALRNLNSGEEDDFFQKYYWMGASYLGGKPLQRDEIGHEKEIAFTEGGQESTGDMTALGLTLAEKIGVLQRLIYYRSVDAETINKAMCTCWDAFDALAAKFGITRQELDLMTPIEITDLCRGGDLPIDLGQRLGSFGISYIEDDFRLYFGEDLEEKLKIFGSADLSHQQSVSGTIAFKGRTTGIARIIFDVKDLEKIQEGDIVVANETMPEYIMGMKKASAFVTNLGGITSHASIVAREMRKPCIIGTKIATQVIRDGDLVEVDADHGVVRVLNRSDVGDDGIVFEKNYTRDTSFSIQQAWGVHCANLMDAPEWTNPHAPIVIDFLHQGAIELWENQSGMQWILDELLLWNTDHPEFFFEQMKVYERQLAFLEPYWKAGHARSSAELQTVFETLYAATRGFLIMYLSSSDERTPKEVKDVADALRKKDRFFDENDTFVRQSLIALRPDIAGYETAVLRNELADIPSLETLQKRLESSIAIGEEYFAEESLSEYAGKHPEYTFHVDALPEDTTRIEGVTGYPGVVRGIVRIIRRKRDQHLVREGEILVAPMTTPDYIPAMKKAGAFVTDEGGIMCHAAIVARELKKPCIIGTKIATQVLKDGDLVEVDADRGIVTVLKKKDDEEDDGQKSSLPSETSTVGKGVTHASERGSKRWIFKKFFHRSEPLIGYEFWDIGERIETPKICNNSVSFEPLFLYTAGRGTSAYYDLVDTKQDPKHLVAYFNEHTGEFHAHLKRYRKLFQEIAKTQNDPKTLFQMLCTVWPAVVLSSVFSNLYRDTAKPELAEAAYALRVDTDTILYDATKRLLSMLIDEGDASLRTDAEFSTMEELLSNKKLSKREIEDRRKRYLYFKGKIYTGDALEQFLQSESIVLTEELSPQGTSQFSGTVAKSGRVTGRVRVIFEEHQLGSVEADDILVTPMTTPNFLPALRRAKGIITDEGGITCHASIISRELKKPCIIGTKIATQVLHDGDLVEVDARNGVVRVLERARVETARNAEKMEFIKSYERDFTLVMEESWVLSLGDIVLEKFGIENPYKPAVVLYATGENLQIWENEKFFAWFMDRLLEENRKGTKFIEDVITSYHSLLDEVRVYLDLGVTTDAGVLGDYKKLLRKGAQYFSLWYYTGFDDRTPEGVRDLVVSVREKDWYFAWNDKFIKDIVHALGGKSEQANLIFRDEFPFVPDNDVLFIREKGVVVLDGDTRIVSSLKTFSEEHPEFVFRDLNIDFKDVKEISGQIANKGKVRGQVRILKNQRNVAHVASGNILVAPMTLPDFLPAMKIAAAFVTDEGGIMCHAAIVARELQKPCVIGTKFATQVLKDGDLVEVDADHGVVRVLERGDESRNDISKSSIVKSDSHQGNVNREYYRDIPFTIMGRYVTYPLDTEVWHTKETSDYFEELFGVWREMLAVHVFDTEYHMYISTPRSFRERLHHRITALTERNPKAMEEIFLRFYDERDDAKKMLRRADASQLARMTTDELIATYEKNRSITHRIVAFDQFTWLAEDYWMSRMEDILAKRLALKKDSPEYTNTLFALIKPREISTTLLEKRAVIDAVRRIRSGEQSREVAADDLARDFGWMPVMAYGNPWDGSHYREELDSLSGRDEESLRKEFSDLTEYTRLRDEDFDRVISKHAITPEDAQIFIDFGLAIDVRNESEYIASLAGFHILPIYDEISKRLHLSILELRTLCESDVISGLRGDTDPHDILAKKGHVIAWGLDGTTRSRIDFSPEEGEAALRYILTQKESREDEDRGEIYRGMTASRGKVVGRAKLVPTPDDNGKVMEGDVLFAYATMTDNLPAMKRAVAVVTEVGGLTCHAAVVSREFGIPCIVNLKNAMTDFHDGDLVEVDADRGIVTVLRKNGDEHSVTTLSKTFSREKPLAYLSLWDESERLGWRTFLQYEMRNSLFLQLPKGQKSSVWHSLEEQEYLNSTLKGRLLNDTQLSVHLLRTLHEHWSILLPYLLKKKHIATVDEFESYYDHLVTWWSAMNTLWCVPDMSEVSEELRNDILQLRSESEKYTEVVSGIMTEFLRKTFPELSDGTYFIAPREVRKLAEHPSEELFATLRARKDSCVLYDGEVYPISDLDRILEEHHIMLESYQLGSEKEFSGTTAYAGKEVGRVKKIYSFSDMKHFETGSILVTEMTNPDYVPIMKIARAIITDEGGALCHAAIASRELRKPCIIGTKIATQVLKDGDLVEVDAERGVVRVLEQKSEQVHEWTVIAGDFNSPLIRNYPWTASFYKYPEFFGVPSPLLGIVSRKNAIEYITDLPTWNKSHEEMKQKVEEEGLFVEKLIDTTNQLGENLNSWSEQALFQADLQKLDSSALIALVNEFVEKQGDVYAYGTTLSVLDFNDFSFVEGNVKRILQEKLSIDERKKYFEILTEPIHNSFAQDQEEDLLRLMGAFSSDAVWRKDVVEESLSVLGEKYPQFLIALKKHAAKYAWVYYAYVGPAYTEENFLQFIKDFLVKKMNPKEKLAELDARKKRIAALRIQYIRDLQPNDFESMILHLVGKLVWAKPRRKDYQSRTYYHLEKLMTEIASRLHISLTRARSIPPEMLKCFLDRGAADIELIDSIFDFHICLPEGAGTRVLFGEEARTFYANHVRKEESKVSEGIWSISGTTARKGIATGHVKIINAPVDIQKMQEGDVLVSLATTPSIIPAIKKAVAIVTDEGGLTCHAAIVSRELGITCIIGTKIATQVLKDGDLVEVDAERGVVTILERADVGKK